MHLDNLCLFIKFLCLLSGYINQLAEDKPLATTLGWSVATLFLILVLECQLKNVSTTWFWLRMVWLCYYLPWQLLEEDRRFLKTVEAVLLALVVFRISKIFPIPLTALSPLPNTTNAPPTLAPTSGCENLVSVGLQRKLLVDQSSGIQIISGSWRYFMGADFRCLW